MAGSIERIKRWFRRSEDIVEDETEGSRPAATPPEGLAGDQERETSTNAQTAGAADEPWSGNG